MRGADIDVSGEVWTYKPCRHKLEHKKKQREVYLGKRAQELLTPILRMGFLFSPADAYEWHLAQKRKPGTPAQPTKRKFSPHYNRNSFRIAVDRACKRAGVEPFSPNQLRHMVATKLRRMFGIEAPQVILGHAKISTTEIYAKRNRDAGMKIAAEVG